MRKMVLTLLLAAAVPGFAQAQQSSPFPAGATLEQKKEIIRQRMAEQRAKQAQQAASSRKQASAAEKPEPKPDPSQHLPLIREWIQVSLDTANFKISQVFHHGNTTKERYRGAEEIAVTYEGKGGWYHREFYIRDGQVIGAELKKAL